MKPITSAGVKFLGFFTVYLSVIGAFIATAPRVSPNVREMAASASIKDIDEKGTSTASAIFAAVPAFAAEGDGEATSDFSTGGVRVQRRGLLTAEVDVLRTAGERDDMQELGECELDVMAVGRIRDAPMTVEADGYDWTSSVWSVGNAESFDEGSLCGDVSDRTTSTDAFESAISRQDGTGFGTLIYNKVYYRAAGLRGEVDTSIRSSMVSYLLITSLGGKPGELAPDTMSYGGEFFSAHVNFVSIEDPAVMVLPLLFHTPSGCQGADLPLDFYGAAALGFGEAIGGRIGYVSYVNETGPPDDRFGSEAIVFDNSSSLAELTVNQLVCDIFEPPSYGSAAWAECSIGTAYVNTSVVVSGCEVLVSPARWMVVGDFFNETVGERSALWIAQFSTQQSAIFESVLHYESAQQTATTSVIQATTQVGFELERANDTTEWALVLVVALEALFMVVALVISSSFVLWSNWQNRRSITTWTEAVAPVGKVLSVAVLLSLGFTPVYLARESESDAANMARNDVYSYLSETTTCFDAVWEGLSLELWCVTTRLASNSLLVRSYSSTFLARYDTLWVTSMIVGGGGFLAYAALSTQTVQPAQNKAIAPPAAGPQGAALVRQPNFGP